ncbi:response regulator transcription factor [Clostridium botulinum]|uniref:Stage 0 sporulation protein A homolog n=1 Tax=Clostridium botulinum (strain Langeland / NCTC 10281 / Type F) TaxID=441772 RepID=A7GD00_CLOBL|nr:response regulator transcription factor [Clostridium botulinum]ABS41182.1 DNA-binding response regulator [Clostridium botulinum F str. Langeland]KKM43329.1 chemotaxis protein CheY [Clostridium botulinum]MBY6791154.1 response regulator transcription factor [Clostridium botulinum]MBY6936385.1 response regulator transcription factor [Clostridium botulinum]MBY6943807.1 response regulator transcription factor [Clostridium botulinum]
MKSILLVEDNMSLNRGIQFSLMKERYNVIATDSIKESQQKLNKEKVDLIILDINLPDGNGFDYCLDIRKTSNIPIIFLTALDSEIDVVNGLDMGADDYITKPFRLRELISRVNAIIRRTSNDCDFNIIQSKDIVFYINEMKIEKHGKEIFLSKTELKLLQYFMKNYQKILSKEQIIENLWNIDGEFINENTVAVNVRRIREKIEEVPSKPEYIQTIRGIGYVWKEGCVRK